MNRQNSGFSLLELAAVITLGGILSAIATIELLPMTRADSAAQQVAIQLRQARLSSIDQRRDFTVTFQGTNELVVVRQEEPSGTTTLYDTFLPKDVTYMVFAGLPDTPDGFGNTYPVNFACTNHTTPCSILFQSDGTVFANGSLINGTVFLGVSGTANTARAVTVMGATGRIRGYRSNGTAWF